MPRPDTLAARLLDANVRHELERLRGDRLTETVTELVDDLFDTVGQRQVADLVEQDLVIGIVTRSLATVPGSAAVSGLVELVVEMAMDGPEEPYPIGELVERARVEQVLDGLLGLTPVLERALDRLTASPLVGTMASRFMGRIVGEVLQANQAVADKVPGLGSLMSFGTSAAAKVMGAADKQFERLIGDAVGKGGTFAVRQLNRIVIETLRDPTTREAVLQVWDLVAAERVTGLQDLVDRGVLEDGEVDAVVDSLRDTAVAVLADEHVARLAEAVVAGVFDRFGGYTPTELLDEFDIDRADVRGDLVRLASQVATALDETGDLERLVRARLAPFYESDAVRRILS